ncbi:fibropellin-3-like isoform X2 [Anneissia japonica]|uniref:fibropellin-3-like isoform X2 n=1 Tax=Anneissia japonica TaxID=1529436 RepID=UPI001425574C|nr:fibropellin-3-like isoform X2 [Anneissia japonica]
MNRGVFITIVLIFEATIADVAQNILTDRRLRAKYEIEERSRNALQPIHDSQEITQVTIVPKSPESTLQENLTKNKVCGLQGTWINSHGSEFTLNVTKEGHLIGKYMTAVEATEGAAGPGYAHILGHASPGGKHRTFGFTVNWNEGTSTTSWTGQCFVCDGQEVLKTTWILSSEVATCNEHWLANRVGQDVFTRSVKQTP